MTKIGVPSYDIEICPISQGELEAVLDVYRQCEDFLALGPVPTASLEMMQKDIELSQGEGGLFCGIYRSGGEIIGVFDYVPGGYHGDPSQAYLELVMIAAPFRSQGIGHAVVEAVENEIRKDPAVRAILAGVQVNNPQAIKFWQREGYRIVSGPERMPDQTTAYGLRKDLAPSTPSGS